VFAVVWLAVGVVGLWWYGLADVNTPSPSPYPVVQRHQIGGGGVG
jgi:hypothetical protein